jgi:hypothetical protein
VRRLIAFVLATLVSLTGAEIALRAHEGTTIFPADGRGYATRPGTRGTNRRGFLERDEVPPGAIAVLGDSMTWGTTTAEEAWPRVAEGMLGRPVSNYSHYGYDGAKEAATLRAHVWQDAPAMIVYAAYSNDLVPTRLITVGEPPTLAWIGPATALGRAILGIWHGRTYRETEDPNSFSAALSDMRAQAAAHDVPFLVFALAPYRLDPLGPLGPLDRLRVIEALCAQVPYASVVPYLRGTPGEYASANPADREHPGPRGQALFAAAFVDVLARLEAGAVLPRVDDPPIALGR